MAAELVETNRLRARTVAQIEPGDIEKVAGHLVTRSYEDPWWDEARGEAMTTERVSLYGLPVVTGRRKPVDQVDPARAAGDVPAPRAGRRRLGRRAPRVRAGQPGAGRRRRRPRAAHAARPPRRRRRAGGVLRRPGTRRHHLRPTVRHLVGEGAARPSPTGSPTGRPTSSTPPPASPTWPTSPRRGRSARPGSRSPTCSIPRRTSTAWWSMCPSPLLDAVERAGLEWQVPGRRLDLVTALVRTLPEGPPPAPHPRGGGRRRGVGPHRPRRRPVARRARRAR